jgi:hypothetical protein
MDKGLRSTRSDAGCCCVGCHVAHWKREPTKALSSRLRWFAGLVCCTVHFSQREIVTEKGLPPYRRYIILDKDRFCRYWLHEHARLYVSVPAMRSCTKRMKTTLPLWAIIACAWLLARTLLGPLQGKSSSYLDSCDPENIFQ